MPALLDPIQMGVKSIGTCYLASVVTNSQGRKRAAIKRVVTFMAVDRGEKASRHGYRYANIEDEKRVRSRAIFDHQHFWPRRRFQSHDRGIGNIVCR